MVKPDPFLWLVSASAKVVILGVDEVMSQPDSYWLLLVLALSVLVLAVKRYRQALTTWLLVCPFYYLPTMFSHNIDKTFGGEGFLHRVAKDVIIVTLVLAWVIRTLCRGKMTVVRSITSISLIGFMCFGLIRSISTNIPAVLVGLRAMLEFTAFYFISVDVFSNETDTRRVLRSWVGASILVSLLGLCEYAVNGFTKYYMQQSGRIRVISTLFNPNSLGWYLAWVNGLAVGLLLSRSRSNGKDHGTLYWSALVLNSICLVFTGSRTSFLVNVIVILAGGLLSSAPRAVITVCIVLIATSLIVSFGTAVELRIAQISLTDKNLIQRIDDIRARVRSTLSSVSTALVGQGYTDSEGQASTGVDSQWANTLYSSGLTGLLLLISALGGAIWHTITHRGSLRLPLFLSLLAILLISASGSILQAFPHALFLWVMVGMAAGSSRSGVSL